MARTIEQAIAEGRSGVGGRVLVSALELPPKGKWPSKGIKDTEFSEVEFSSPLIIGGLLSRPLIENCKFSNSHFGGVIGEKATFRQCKFDGVSIGVEVHAVFGETLVENCSFRDCEIRSVDFHESILSKCTFEKCSFASVKFSGCKLNSLRISGEMESVVFSDCAISGVDLSSVRMLEVGFTRKCTVSRDVLFPRSAENFVVREQMDLQLVKSAAEAILDQSSFGAFEEDIAFLRSLGFPLVLDVSAFDSLGEKMARKLISTLAKAN